MVKIIAVATALIVTILVFLAAAELTIAGMPLAAHLGKEGFYALIALDVVLIGLAIRTARRRPWDDVNFSPPWKP